MGIGRVLAYPFRKIYRGGLVQVKDTHVESYQLARFYDIAKKLVQGLGLPKFMEANGERLRTYQVIGNLLAGEVEGKNIILDRATLQGDLDDIFTAVKKSLPLGFSSKMSQADFIQLLTELRILPQKKGKLSFLQRFYDPFSPIKRLRALDTIIEAKKEGVVVEIEREQKMARLEARDKTLRTKAAQDAESLKEERDAYLKIMNAIYQVEAEEKDVSDPISEEIQKDPLRKRIGRMFRTVTDLAYQLIGRTNESQAAAWLAINHDGTVGIKYQYVVAEENMNLQKTPVYKLKKEQDEGKIVLSSEQNMDTVKVKDKGKKYISHITTKEWEDIKLREDLVVVEKEEKGKRKRVLYKRIPKLGSDLVKERGIVVRWAVKLLGGGKKNACIELKPVTPEEAGLKPGEIVPYVVEGSKIVLISAGGKKPELYKNKIKLGKEVQNFLKIGIIEQPLHTAMGNVAHTTKQPVDLMIFDVKRFKRRHQNEFLIGIVKVKSYYIRSLFEFNEDGEAVCLGCLEVTNPEVIPQELTKKDRKELEAKHEKGKIFARLASAGIMMRIVQDERDRESKRSMGPKIFDVVQKREYHKLAPTRIDDVSTLFVDVAGFTKMSDKLSPEEVFNLLNKDIFEELYPIVRKNNGRVDKNIGDAIMANWGVPVGEAKDIEKAVQAAIDMQLAIQNLNLNDKMIDFFKEHKIDPLGIKIGINTGPVLAGNLGKEGDLMQYTEIGDAVNVASRLEGAGKRGHILIGEQTYEHLPEDFKAKLVDNFNLYNRDFERVRSMLLDTLISENIVVDRAIFKKVNYALERYKQLYKDAEEEDIFVPSVIWARNKGAVGCYYVRWDRHAYRYQFLKQALEEAGLKELPVKSSFETQPLTADEVHRQIEKEPEENRPAMLDTYEGLIIKKTSTPSS